MAFLIFTLGLISVCAIHIRVQSAPIEIPSFESCHVSTYYAPPQISPLYRQVNVQCCPPPPIRPIIAFSAPKTRSRPLNVRRPIQCADETYLDKLEKAYQLMRALPDDNPHSFFQQSVSHCAYCGGAFSQPGTNNSIDIHFTWLFFPWHRAFLYFHEKILQNLLNDTTFALPFWNWDQQLSGYEGDDLEQYSPSAQDQCFKSGNKIPAPYLNSLSHNRSSLIVRRQFATDQPAHTVVDLANILRNFSVPSNKSLGHQVSSNLNLLHRSLVKSSTTPELFFGAPYRWGDPQLRPKTGPEEIYGGAVEMGAHANVHIWTRSLERPGGNLSFPGVWNGASDPLFFAHHSNMDRLWTVWKSLGGRRKDINDPDWLNASFLFYDENKDLVRIKISDLLSVEKLGYTYEKVDNSWISYDNAPICSELSRSQLDSVATRLPIELPLGGITLDRAKPYMAFVRRPVNALMDGDVGEILAVQGIRLDRNLAGQFTVFLNHPEANVRTPWHCAEFVGRFSYSALVGGPARNITGKNFSFKADITNNLKDLQVGTSPGLIISIVYNPLFGTFPPADQLPEISFNSITIEARSS